MIPHRYLILPVLFAAISAVAHDHSNGLQFHQNKGQWPQQVLYRALTPGGAVYVERSAFTYLLQKGGSLASHGTDAAAEPFRQHAFRVHFEGGSAMAGAGEHKLPYYVNYFLGNDPANWAAGCEVFAQVELKDVYPGIDLKVDGHGGLKYDWLVAAGADPSLIQMRYEGQDGIFIHEGLLYIKTSAGDVIEHRPIAWQEIGGERFPLRCEYELKGDRIGFKMDQHDPQFPLVIDPVVVFSSLTGSSGDNFGSTATYDATGHLYGSGIIRETGYPVTPGVIQSDFVGFPSSTCDIGISKFTPDGTDLVWSTYLGGTGSEMPHSLVVNSLDELYLIASTGSTDFPVTTGAFDSDFNGGTLPPFSGSSYGFTFTNGADLIVAHLNATATALIGSTYVGGTGNDGLNQEPPLNRNYGDPFRGEIILNELEEPMVVTTTLSTDLTTTVGAFQTTLAGGMDAYLFRMDPTLSTMLWATYYGGTGHEAGYGVQLDSSGDIFISGGTTSTDLPMAGTPAFPSFSGVADGYIAKFPGGGGALTSATYLGTTSLDQAYFIQVDLSDDVYVVGSTLGIYPVSPGQYSTPQGMQFLHKFDNDLANSLWSTRIGSSGNENLSLTAFLVSNCGQIYMSGWGSSTNGSGMAGVPGSTFGLPVTTDAFQATTDGGDFWLAMLEPDAIELGYATFFGGSAASEHVDGGTSRFDKNGIVYHAVCASCGFGPTSYPTTPGAWSDSDMGVNCNLGVFKIDFEQNVQAQIEVNTNGLIACLGTSLLFNAIGNANSWVWDLGDGSPLQNGQQITHIYDDAGEYTVMLVGLDSTACNFADTAFVEIQIVGPADLQPSFTYTTNSTCQGFTVELTNTSTGSTEFFWDFGDGTSGSSTSHFYQLPGEYDITVNLIDPVCPDTAMFMTTVVLDPPNIPLDLPSPVALCDGQPVTLSVPTGFTFYLWSTGEFTPSITVTQPGTYSIAVNNGLCAGSDTIQVVAQPPISPAADALICPGSSMTIGPTFTPLSITWNTGATTPAIIPDDSGEYSFTAIDPYGCPFQDTILVTLATGSVGMASIPNVFSPNGDSKNDTFQVTGLAIDQFNMEIYNRWGQVMYTASNPSAGWNGGLDNSADKVPDGTYFYIITLKDLCSDEPQTTHTGHVTLVR
jgi:gliding motility-associated-like protein